MSSKRDLIVCTRKYFVAALNSLIFMVDSIIGMKDIRFSSILIHNMIQLDAVITIIDDVNRVMENKLSLGDGDFGSM